ncbi:MAG: cation diffusion facilitator family transporter [Bacillota bacterium]
MEIIKKIFIKNYKNTDDSAVRFKYGIVAGVLGVVSNVVLFALKIIVGLIGNSITIVADAINNLADAGSSVVTTFGFKLSSRPADKEHPYGHARYEQITALIVALIVLAIGVLLGASSVSKIIYPVMPTVSLFTYIVLGISIVGKLVQWLMYRDFGTSINSKALFAASTDSRNDIIATTAALVTVILADIAKINIDGYMGLAVSIFIVISSLILIKDTINPLLGTPPSKELVSAIATKIKSYKGVKGIHDLMVHSYGAGETFAIVHVEVDAHSDIMVSHDMIDVIERAFKDEMNIHLAIHMDPIEEGDNAVMELKIKILAKLTEYDSSLSMHDFRIVAGNTHTNILFDIVVPYESNITKEKAEELARLALCGDDVKYDFIIEVDRGYI